MEPIQLGPLKIWPFGLFFAAMLVPFFAGVAYLMRKKD